MEIRPNEHSHLTHYYQSTECSVPIQQMTGGSAQVQRHRLTEYVLISSVDN